MAKLRVHNPPRAKLKSSGFMGEPTGEIDIISNGRHNVKTYATANVQVPDPPTKEKRVAENGEYTAADENVYGFSKVVVDVQLPSAEYATTLERARAEIAQDNEYFSDISEAVQNKTGQTEPYEKDELASAIDGIATPSAMIDGSLTTYTDDTVTSLRQGAFYSYTSLQSVSFENVITVGASCFNYCSRIVNVYIPKATIINNAAFASCGFLTRLELLSVESIGTQVFLNDTRLTAVILGKRASLSSSGSMPASLIFYVQPDDFTWYQTATNWADLYGQGKVKSINDLPE